ncbi:MAG: hypothetical protein LBM63_05120 [Rikenellaceae bacterium]|jgi:methyl-accepting chemotaxis protein|nr:hypothetical protein [Rikenellaceae bacterium]
METKTITKIAELKEEINDNLDSYTRSQRSSGADMNVGQFGSENEYSINGIIAGVKNILTDISYLAKAHNIFIKLSTYNERNVIYNQLNSLNTWLQNGNHNQIVIYLDQLKVSLRCYQLRSDKDRFIEFSGEIDNLRRIALSLEGVISDTKDKITESESVYENITDIKEKYDEVFEKLETERDSLTETLESFTEKFGDFQTLAETAEQNEATISEKLEAAKESEETFDDFIMRIKG